MDEFIKERMKGREDGWMNELMIDLVPDRGRVCEASMMFPKQSVSRHYPSHPR